MDTIAHFRPSAFGTSPWFHASCVNLVIHNAYRERMETAARMVAAEAAYDLRDLRA